MGVSRSRTVQVATVGWAGLSTAEALPHDATLRQKLPQLRNLPPRYVVWGDGTTDEMCLGLLTATFR